MNVVQSRRRKGTGARGRRPAGRAAPPPHREERARREVKPAQERRKDILDGALRLFARQGFNDTAVGDIAAEAGMATGTVYLYFPSKEHVLLGLHDRFREEMDLQADAAAVDAVDRAGRGEEVDYRDTVDTILDSVAAYFKENRDLVTVCTKYRPEFVDPDYSPTGPHLGIVARALTAGVELGMIHTSDPEMTSYLFEAALAYNLHMHIAYGDPPDIDRFIAAAKEMVHKTLALPRELQQTRTRAASTPPARSAAGSHRRRSVR